MTKITLRLGFAYGSLLSIAMLGAVACMGEEGVDEVEEAVDSATAVVEDPLEANREHLEYFLQAPAGTSDVGTSEADASGAKLENGKDDGPSPAAGCVRVEYCQHPSSELGTTCFWDACSRSSALAECRADARRICGRVNEPVGLRRP